MNFNSLHFIAFFFLVLSICLFISHRVRVRNWILLIASYYFYGWWDWRFLSLIIFSTVIDYIVGLLLNVTHVDPDHPPERTRYRKRLILISVCTNLIILGFFKYFNFFIGSARDLLESMGLLIHLTTLNIILPVGVSFYTFQALSYTIDVYRGKLDTERSFLNFALFVAFFPQLVAGPIERASNLLPQVRNKTRITLSGLYSGFFLIGWGLFKKVVVADNIAKVADTVFAGSNPTGFEVLLGVYSFAVQIYCDFSAYSDIAMGSARCLGFELMQNFNLPYFATNPSDFWQRWHISLSSWLRDYLYLPLGGNRKGPRRTYINLMLTMLLGGLWHGAAWTFVIWGTYHGLLLIIHRAVSPWMKRYLNPKREPLASLWVGLRIAVIFNLVCVSWLLFRADNMQQVFQMAQAMFTDIRPNLNVLGLTHLRIFLICWVGFWLVQIIQWQLKDLQFVYHLPVLARAVIYVVLILGFLWFGEYGGEPFIYFQF